MFIYHLSLALRGQRSSTEQQLWTREKLSALHKDTSDMKVRFQIL